MERIPEYELIEVSFQYLGVNQAVLRSGDLTLEIECLRVHEVLGKTHFRIEIELKYPLQQDLSAPAQLCIPHGASCRILPGSHNTGIGEWRSGEKHLAAIPETLADRTMLVRQIQQAATRLVDRQTPED